MTPAARALAEAERMLKSRPGDKRAIYTDAEAYPDRVIVAIAVPGAGAVVTIAAHEYNGWELALMAGFENELTAGRLSSQPPGPDIEALKKKREQARAIRKR